MYQCHQLILIGNKKTPLFGHVLNLLLGYIHTLLHLIEPLVLLGNNFFLMLISKHMDSILSTPDNISMDSWKRKIYDLREVLIDCLDTLLTRCSRLDSQCIDYMIYFFIDAISFRLICSAFHAALLMIWLLYLLILLNQNLKFFD